MKVNSIVVKWDFFMNFQLVLVKWTFLGKSLFEEGDLLYMNHYFTFKESSKFLGIICGYILNLGFSS